ncbi:MAG: hypothetical protein RJB53_317 [Pseudomonadota bacterium]|jgi:cytosine/adenosine deaminase-related metal-dependent hydrolase
MPVMTHDISATLIRGARVLTLDSQNTEFSSADILLSNGVITAVGPSLSAPEGCKVIEAAGMLAMPGLINAHFHSPGNLMRGQLDCLPLEIFMLREVPPLANEANSERLIKIRTLLGAAEMLRGGITCVMDDAYHVPIASIAAIDSICNAYSEIGIRARVAIDQPNIVEYDKYPFLKDLLTPALRAQLESSPRQTGDELIELYRYLITQYGTDQGLIQPAISCSAPHRVTPDYLKALNYLSQEYALPFNMHILETKLQRVYGTERLGKSLVAYADDHGILHEHSVVIHAIWVDQADINRLAKHNVMIAHNPICNLKLGSGIAPFREWRDAGLRVCLGSDEANTDDRINMWDIMKTAGMVHTLRSPDWHTWPTAEEILEIAIRGGADALGWKNRIGSLQPGYQADLILLDLDRYAFTPLNDLIRQLIYAESGSSVVHVFVAGNQVVDNGKITTIDEKALRSEARALLAETTHMADDSINRLEPYYRQMVLRAHEEAVFNNRRLEQ